MGEIRIPYRPRDVFDAYHSTDKRFSLSVAHRRCGKTVARINKLIIKAGSCRLLNPRFGYLAPSFVQAKDISWKYLKHYSQPFIDVGGQVNESELSVVLPHNKATIRLYGAENAQRMNGIYFDGICIDEAQLIPKSVLSTIIMPCLADRKGWLDIAGKPRGWHNMLGELYKDVANDPEWFVQVLRASETGILDNIELAQQRKLMSEDEYDQEFECSFDAAITGSVYGKWMQAALEEKRITDLDHNPNLPVYTAWDMGYGDSNIIWFYQIGASKIGLIDYYEYHGEEIGYYCDVLKGKCSNVSDEDNERRKQYRYERHDVPIDATFELQAAGGRSMLEQAWNPHGTRLTAIPECTYDTAIQAVRTTLPRCVFSERRCSPGINALIGWHFEWDEKMGKYRDKPRHDGNSHACRAFDILARMWTQRSLTVKNIDDRKRENDFISKRRKWNLAKDSDPYRLKPIKHNH